MKENILLTADNVVINGVASQKVTVDVDGCAMGHFYVARTDSIVEKALILVGYTKVKTAGEGWRTMTLSLSEFRESIAEVSGDIGDAVTGQRGDLLLTKRFSTGLDDYRIDVTVDRMAQWESATPGMGMRTLSQILHALGYAVVATENGQVVRYEAFETA
jgi:hypothetical protein